MGVYIPNMEKPKSCDKCPFTCEALQFFNGTDIPQSCPLTEIVTCGECKYMRKYALRSDEPAGIWCHRWSVPRLVTDDAFCSYGERCKED